MNVKTCHNRSILNPCTLQGRNYQVDPYIGCEHYCYYCYALNQAETDWRKEIFIHENIADKLESELAGIEPQTIYMGWHTDPYQPCEIQYRQTRQVLELLAKNGFSASILTKSDLVLRDMDLLQNMETASISFSLAFNDNRTRRFFEANTMDIEQRIQALHQLKNAGVRTGALLCPVIPYITDAGELIELLAPCTDVIWIYGLSIDNRSNPSWLNLKRIFNRHYKNKKDQIESAVFSRDHDYWVQLRKNLKSLKSEQGLNLNIHL